MISALSRILILDNAQKGATKGINTLVKKMFLFDRLALARLTHWAYARSSSQAVYCLFLLAPLVLFSSAWIIPSQRGSILGLLFQMIEFIFGQKTLSSGPLWVVPRTTTPILHTWQSRLSRRVIDLDCRLLRVRATLDWWFLRRLVRSSAWALSVFSPHTFVLAQ